MKNIDHTQNFLLITMLCILSLGLLECIDTNANLNPTNDLSFLSEIATQEKVPAAPGRGDLPHDGTNPITISEPGIYNLTNNITGSNFTDISITATNVTLDLNGFTISGGTIGIDISGDKILIKNGTVRNTSTSNIKLTGNKCTLKNINSIDSPIGFELSGATNSSIKNCLAIDIANANGPAYGFYTENGTHNTFEKCIAKSISSTSNSASGFLGINETKSTLTNCSANSVSGTNSSGIRITSSQLELTNINSAKILPSRETQGRAMRWTTINGAFYLAVGGYGTTADKRSIRIYSFTSGGVLTDIASINVFNNEAGITSIDWLHANNTYYLLWSGNPQQPDNEMGVITFDPATETLTRITSSEFEYDSQADLNEARWLTANDTYYIGTVGAERTGNEALVFSFDGQTLTGLDGFEWNANLNSCKWKTYKNSHYFAIGGASSGGKTVQVLEFDTSTETLSALDATFDTDITVNNLSWLEYDNSLYLATVMNNGSNNIRVLKFDPEIETLNQYGTAYATHGDMLYECDWLVTGSNIYLAVAGRFDTNQQYVKIYKFDPNAQTLTQTIAYGNSNNFAYAIQWLDAALISPIQYLAFAQMSTNIVDLLGFKRTGSNFCTVKNCEAFHVTGTTNGFGFSIAEGNLLLDSFAYDNDINYERTTPYSSNRSFIST